jgi:deazaflavin-dependent oxidoreductase (nitroreductase family)
MDVQRRPSTSSGGAGESRARARRGPRGLMHVVTLEVRGRRTGRLLSFPVVVADYDGERYLVAMLGENANWVRNVRAAKGQAVLRHGRREAVRLEEVNASARAPILQRYCASRREPALTSSSTHELPLRSSNGSPRNTQCSEFAPTHSSANEHDWTPRRVD